jgi:hypothetical protein
MGTVVKPWFVKMINLTERFKTDQLKEIGLLAYSGKPFLDFSCACGESHHCQRPMASNRLHGHFHVFWISFPLLKPRHPPQRKVTEIATPCSIDVVIS